MSQALTDDLVALFTAERRARELHASLVARPRDALVDGLAAAVREALALDDLKEKSLRLARIAMVLGDLEGDRTVDLLVDVLASDAPEARVVAGEALEGLAFDRFKEVALGIERAVDRLPAGSPALTELPFLLAEVAEPGCVKLLGRFLKHPDPEAVAAAIEAMVELGDPAAASLLAPLERDARQVQLEDEAIEAERVAIGDLAHEARALLLEMAEETERAATPKPNANKGGGDGAGGKKRR